MISESIRENIGLRLSELKKREREATDDRDHRQGPPAHTGGGNSFPSSPILKRMREKHAKRKGHKGHPGTVSSGKATVQLGRRSPSGGRKNVTSTEKGKTSKRKDTKNCCCQVSWEKKNNHHHLVNYNALKKAL